MSVLKSRRMATQEKRLLNVESIMLVAYDYIIYIFLILNLLLKSP